MMAVEFIVPYNELLEEVHRREGFDTTFWMDFSIADKFGAKAVSDTFRRAFDEWKHEYRYLTDLVMVLNHKTFQWVETNPSLATLYNELWLKANEYAEENLTGDALSYYYRVTD